MEKQCHRLVSASSLCGSASSGKGFCFTGAETLTYVSRDVQKGVSVMSYIPQPAGMYQRESAHL